MLRNLKNRSNRLGITVLGIGVTLLILTFASACIFLTESLQTAATQNFEQTFSATLQLLIGASIRVMYLGIMGWTGSLITIRGVNIITQTAPKAQTAGQQQQANAKLKNEAKPETTHAEPELIAIPLEEAEQQEKP
jgi:hypothetical protein